MKEIKIGVNEANQRLDKLIHKYLRNAGTGFIYKMIRKKNITLNDKRCEGNEILNEGDIVKLWLSDDTIEKFRMSESAKSESNDSGLHADQNRGAGKLRDDPHRLAAEMKVVYEDEDIIVFNKPAGLLSQKAIPSDISVNDVLLSMYPPTETFTPSICNRLDRNTSGLIICGKSLRGLQDSSEMLRNRKAHKDYIAVVEGVLSQGSEIKTEVEGKELHSEVRPISIDGNHTYVMVRLYTGKTHQIRIHLSGIGFPILGDRKYGNGKGAKRQLLHAFRLTMPDGKVIEAPIPEDFKWELGKPGAFEDLPSKF